MIQQTVPEPGRFIKVATVGDIASGNVLAARLRSEGIEVRVHSQAFGPYPMTVGEMAATELWVMSDRVADANSILLDAEVNDAIATADPDVDLEDFTSRRPLDHRLMALGLGALMAGLFIIALLRVY